ncbi:MAG: tyrosine-type recombinase/integrase [Loktanella sp.]|nr:tyrosine-type recombinase/integrase [Loktanella sp.]
MTVKLKHVDKTDSGGWRYRRRVPTPLVDVIGRVWFRHHFEAKSLDALVREYPKAEAAFGKLVKEAKDSLSAVETQSPREAWFAAKLEADAMSAGVIGLENDEDDYDQREVVAESLRGVAGKALTITALMDPERPAPEHTLQDARNIYLKERLGDDGAGRKRLDRVFKRVEESLGDLTKLPLSGLKREHARKVRDHMLQSGKKGGGTLSPATVERELNQVTAVISLALREFDLAGQVANPFEKLSVGTAGKEALQNESDKRDPLPADVIKSMRDRLSSGAVRLPEIGLIWRVLEGTGCRMSEVTGLLVDDVDVKSDLPHIRIQWNEDRRLKTQVSIRSVPLVGDALAAAKEALELPREGRALFPRYSGKRGGDGASQVLMKHLRTITKNPRHTNHSLRHNMKDWLVTADVPELVQNLLLGHTLGGEGNTAYGGDRAKLVVTTKALKKALGLVPEGA